MKKYLLTILLLLLATPAFAGQVIHTGTLTIDSLLNCPTIYTDLSGNLSCGSATGEVDPIWNAQKGSYLTITNAAATYLPLALAASTYLTQANAASTYLTQTNASATYLPLSASTSLNYVKIEADPIWSAVSSSYLTVASAASTYLPLSASTSLPYLTTSTGLTVSNFASPNISQWTNNSGYLTSSSLTPYLTTTSAASTYIPLSVSSTFLTTTTAANTYLTIAVSTSLAYVKTEADPVFMAASASLPYVTSVSVVTVNGISGTVSSSTTTPAITLTLRAITPTTVNGMSLINDATYDNAFGYLSLNNNVTGTYNTAVGYMSLFTNTGGDNNVALGFKALDYNTTGDKNVALGYEALYDNTTANNNVAVGTAALTTNSTGYANSALGGSSLFYNTTGNSNTAIGYESMFENTTGTRNTALGVYALTGNKTGDYNTGVGYDSMHSLTVGNNNTALGYYSLHTNNGSNNVVLGAYAGSHETGDNSFYVDNQDRWTSALDKTNALLYGTFSSTPSGQTLDLNAYTNVSKDLTVSRSLLVPGTNGVSIGTTTVQSNTLFLNNTYLRMNYNYGITFDQSQGGYIGDANSSLYFIPPVGGFYRFLDHYEGRESFTFDAPDFDSADTPKFGIDSSTPNYTLSVNGDAYISGTTTIYGLLAINTTDTDDKLSVAGTSYLNGTTTIRGNLGFSVASGYIAGIYSRAEAGAGNRRAALLFEHEYNGPLSGSAYLGVGYDLATNTVATATYYYTNNYFSPNIFQVNATGFHFLSEANLGTENSTFTPIELLTVRNIDNLGGYLGIGNTAPVRPLSIVVKNGAGQIDMTENGTDTSDYAGLEMFNDLGHMMTLGITSDTNIAHATDTGYIATYRDLVFYTNNDYIEQMRILSNGNVGISTSTPGSKLTVDNGDIYIASSTRGIIMKDTVKGGCSRITLSSGVLVVSATTTCP